MTTPMRDVRIKTRRALAAAGFVDAPVEADALLAAVLGVPRGDIELAVLLDRDVSAQDAARIHRATRERARHRPLQHIVGTAPFAGLDLAVGPGVFVPRPETEVVVERVRDFALQNLAEHPSPTVVDLGSGSGAIALGVANSVPEARVYAVEGSPHAWPWLRRNIRETGLDAVVPVFGRIGEVPTGLCDVDVVASNPPYVPSANTPRDPEVRLFDPELALYGGTDGLDIVRTIAGWSAAVLREGGLLIMEHDDHHGGAVRELLAAAGWRDAETVQDLADRDRATLAYRAPDYHVKRNGTHL